jgi:hypothetical protein
LGQSVKDIACRLTDVEYSVVGEAAASRGISTGNFLVEAGVRLAHTMGISAPYKFAGRLYVTHGLPDGWYEATSEGELIDHLKIALRARDLEAASAMALELLDFPASWDEVDLNERALAKYEGVLHGTDPELAGLVNAAIGQPPVAGNPTVWDCYKAILRTSVPSHPPVKRLVRASF